jgi:hypothetical protein
MPRNTFFNLALVNASTMFPPGPEKPPPLSVSPPLHGPRQLHEPLRVPVPWLAVSRVYGISHSKRIPENRKNLHFCNLVICFCQLNPQSKSFKESFQVKPWEFLFLYTLILESLDFLYNSSRKCFNLP